MGPTRLACRTRPMGYRRVAVAVALLVAAYVISLWAPPLARAASPQERLVVGLKAFRDGFHELASKELRAFLAAAPEDPRRPEVLYVLAQSDLARKDWGAARKTLEELIRQGGPRGREGRYWLGWLDAREDKTATALQDLEAYLAEPGGERRTDALFLAAELARKSGAGSAVKYYEAFLAAAVKDPRRSAAWLRIVQSRVKVDPAAAVAVAKRGLKDPVVRGDAAALEPLALAGVEAARAAGDLPAEGAFWQELMQRAAGNDLRLRARYEAASVLLRTGEKEQGGQFLEAYLKDAPEGPYAVRAHLLLADLAQERGDGEQALAHLEQALAHPEDPAVAPRRRDLERAALGLALGEKDRSRAAVHARALLAADGSGHPEDQGLAHFTLGSVATDPAAAVAEWDAVPADTPRYRESRLLAARALLAEERPADALSRLEPLLGAPDPGSAVHLTALAAADAAGDLARAAAFSAWLAKNPPPGRDGVDFLYRRALLLRRAGDEGAYREALEALASRVPAGPRGAWAAAELTAAAVAGGDWQAVLRWVEAAGSGPDPDLAEFQKAEALAALDRVDEARATLEALTRRPGPHRPAALARLGALRDRTGDAAGALRAYRGALDEGLEGEPAAWVRERIAALEKGKDVEGQGGGTGQ